MEASGRKAAFLGREDGSFEAWVYPIKVLHDFRLSFGTPDYADPIPGASLATDAWTCGPRPARCGTRTRRSRWTRRGSCR